MASVLLAIQVKQRHCVPAGLQSVTLRDLLTLTPSPVGGVTIEARYAGLAVLAGGQVLTLLTDTLINALAVAIALACWKSKS